MDAHPFQSADPRADEASEVIQRYADMVYRIARVQMKNPHDADDVFQDVFLAYIRSDLHFDDEAHRKAWLIRTTLNRCKKWFGSAWVQKTVALDDTLPAADHPEYLELWDAVRRLPKQHQTVLLLFYGEQMQAAEIGAALGIREKTVRMQLTRARRKLKQELESEEPAEDISI